MILHIHLFNHPIKTQLPTHPIPISPNSFSSNNLFLFPENRSISSESVSNLLVHTHTPQNKPFEIVCIFREESSGRICRGMLACFSTLAFVPSNRSIAAFGRPSKKPRLVYTANAGR
ncbi:hypothetical protein JTE90_018623 [Oedothorax gibbosus]|uniref:Uncharacterized protein n=1 Tax=Oedothorax gibbosus TaxID=931172 RepID=A0AAV6UMP4_9ARAC|nr:hypothetical protein JTE90_018623 [Oedothorax gibbosus]